MDLIRHTPPDNLPLLVLESWPPKALAWLHGPTTKASQAEWSSLHFHTRYRLLDSLSCGGAIRQSRCLVARLRTRDENAWTWPDQHPPSVPRPMGNLLTPWGLLGRNDRRPPSYSLPRSPPDSLRDPMPDCLGAWINTPHGIRRLLGKELARGLGCDKSDLESLPGNPDPLLRHTTSILF